tara:strand:- start:13059 stop:14501 length:1443 start_codon:yes stop_codon:yes gene_type:complete
MKINCAIYLANHLNNFYIEKIRMINSFLNDKGYFVCKNELEVKQKHDIINDLSLYPQSFCKTCYIRDSDKFKIYRESPTKYRLPRFYGIEKFGYPIKNKLPMGITIDCKFNGKLKSCLNQNEACNTIINSLKSKGGAVLSLPTGYGKTTCALYILSQMSRKTLIIVHKEFLLNQWKQRIEQFLPTAKIGTIQAKIIDVIGKDIVIGMLQSLSMKEYDQELFRQFGMTIIDETHHICSKTFSQAMLIASSCYMLGLSATPERKDGLTCVLNWFVGNVEYSIKRENQLDVCIKSYIFDCNEFKEPPPYNSAGTISIPSIINILCSIIRRNDMLVKIIVDNLNNGRKIIILSERREHCKILCSKVLQIVSDSKTCGLYIGGMKQNELNQNESCDAIFATYALANEGLDIPTLNTLVMATPKADVIQSCGRILRESGEKTHKPLIIDIIDKFGCLQSQYRKRLTFYKSSGFHTSKSFNINEIIT